MERSCMSGAPDVIRLVRMWVEKAEEDLLVAQRLLSPGEPCLFSSVCFHAQQAVEKYVKRCLSPVRWTSRKFTTSASC